MDEVIFKMPVGITVEFAGGKLTDADISGFFAASFFAPGYTDFGGEFGDIFVIFGVSPKLNLGTRLFFDNFTNYGDGWRDMTPRAAPYY